MKNELDELIVTGILLLLYLVIRIVVWNEEEKHDS